MCSIIYSLVSLDLIILMLSFMFFCLFIMVAILDSIVSWSQPEENSSTCGVSGRWQGDILDNIVLFVCNLQVPWFSLFTHVRDTIELKLYYIVTCWQDVEELISLPPEKVLLKWMNFHLKKAGYEKQVTNFSSDVKVSEMLIIFCMRTYSNISNYICLNPAPSDRKTLGGQHIVLVFFINTFCFEFDSRLPIYWCHTSNR